MVRTRLLFYSDTELADWLYVTGSVKTLHVRVFYTSLQRQL